MKARYRELLDRAVEALSNAIEIYNKPNMVYREETFVILNLNAWELLLKAKWLHEHQNRLQSLYVNTAPVGKKPKYKRTAAGIKVTHGVGYLARKLSEKKKLDPKAVRNIEALIELRNAAIHFYLNKRNPILVERILELGLASLKNFISAAREWFDEDFSKMRTPILPLSIDPIPAATALQLNRDEKAFIEYLQRVSSDDDDPTAPYSVAVNVEVKFTRSKSATALPVQITSDPTAPAVRLSEEEIRARYPLDYKQLTAKCKQLYKDFKVNKDYHTLRKSIESNRKYTYERRLDPNKPRPRKVFYSTNIFTIFDKHYERKK